MFNNKLNYFKVKTRKKNSFACGHFELLRTNFFLWQLAIYNMTNDGNYQ